MGGENLCDGHEGSYDAVVVGSGYGGSVAACRMSLAGIKVCLMEKGQKWEAQEFPTNSFSMLSTFRMEKKSWGFSFGPKDALVQVYDQGDSVAAVACGLGGGSLVNAGVMVSTPLRVRRKKSWPEEWENDWEICEASASAMLRSQSLPVEFPNAILMGQVMTEEIEDCRPRPIKLSMNFDCKDGSSNSCLACGNCLSGCPYNAKNSTDKNYLASAVQSGCTIKTNCQVQYVMRNLKESCREGDEINKQPRRRWRVYINNFDYVLCDFVVISAGVLGTIEILFHSARRGLRISERLGYGFSSNGGNCAYLAASSAPLNSYGLTKSELSKVSFKDRPGPSISSSYTSSLGFTIQSAVLPTAFPYLLFKGIITYGWPNAFWFFHGVIEKLNHMLGLKASQAMVLNVMGYDDCDGRITLEEGVERVSFTSACDPLLPRKVQALQKLARKLGGILFMSRSRSTSVHLLGGCNAASNPSRGVCDSNGQVFYLDNPPKKHPGLYVCDASLVPCSVGINPCLTIATIAEHVSRYLVPDVLKYKSSAQFPTSRQLPHSDKQCAYPEMTVIDEKRSIVRITERMSGYIGGMPCKAYFKMKVGDHIEQIPTLGESHPLLRGKVSGYIIFKSLEKERLYIVDGTIDMCKVDSRAPYTQYMHYSNLVLVSASGSRYILEGKKIMSPYLLFSYAWWESRRVYVTLRTLDGLNEKQQTIDLQGELFISFIDLIHNLLSLRGYATLKFLYILLQSIFQTYILQTPRGSHQDFLPSDLNAKPYPPSVHHEIQTGDGVNISCRQWKPKLNTLENEKDEKCPVLLINGYFGESYWLPTEPNDLVRTLLESGHETWLLQSRLHPMHPSNNCTIEDMGKFDIPAVLEKVSELHGPSVKVHVVAHCVGGLAIHIALMGGHVSATIIASLCCTNSSMFFKVTTSSLVKMALPLLPISLAILGKDNILPISHDSKMRGAHKLVRSIARWIPRYERCTYDECNILSGIFGNVFWHENVSSSLHHCLNTMSSQKLPMSAFPHLRKICTKGFIVDPDGKNNYMVYPERMAVHTLYISGGRSLLATPQTSFLGNQYMKLHQPHYRHTRVVVDGFGHSDLLIGEESYTKVFPYIISHINEQERNGSVDDKECRYEREALSWSWDEHPCETSKCGLLSWIWVFLFLLLLLFLIIVFLQ